MTWLVFGVAFYLLAAVCIGALLAERTRSGQVAYLVAGIAGFFMATHSLLAFVRTVMTTH